MPTIFSHPAVVVGIAPWLRRCPVSLAILAAFCSVLPDADVAAFALEIPYEHPLGHRGFTHSIVFAIVFALLAALAYVRVARNGLAFRVVFVVLFIATVSHGLLDAMTTGGKGVGFFIPFLNERYFFPFRPIRVSPLSAGDFLERARPVLLSEIRWVWLPALIVAMPAVSRWFFHRMRRNG